MSPVAAVTTGARPRGIVVSAPKSGAGKTTITLGLARAFRNRGLTVQAFKSGPDYIDPAFHARATGRASFNLDSWSMPPHAITALLGHAHAADVAIVEGAMGLYDGAAHRGACGNGSSADIAARTGWPVVIVIDCTAQAQTAAAVALGLARYRVDVKIAGVILNKISGERHFKLVCDGFEGTGIDILGWLPRQNSIAMPERHLGLVQADETAELDQLLEAVARFVDEHVDIARVLEAAEPMSHTLADEAVRSGATAHLRPPGQRIALARDAAFSFVYPHMLDVWKTAGAEILPFSPLADEAPDAGADVCWLPGGYPELHAGRIATARTFLDGLREFAAKRPVHGECGGYMVLGDALVDQSGTAHAMAGLLGLVTSFEKRRLHLGYREARLTEPMPGYAAGAVLRGHEFHYASTLVETDTPLACVVDAAGEAVDENGSRRGHVTGTFFHLVAEAS